MLLHCINHLHGYADDFMFWAFRIRAIPLVIILEEIDCKIKWDDLHGSIWDCR